VRIGSRGDNVVGLWEDLKGNEESHSDFELSKAVNGARNRGCSIAGDGVLFRGSFEENRAEEHVSLSHLPSQGFMESCPQRVRFFLQSFKTQLQARFQQ
jgi:hypothetical protein